MIIPVEPLRKGSVPGIRGESFTPLKPLRKKSVSRIQRELFQPVPQRQETITSKGGEINLKDEIGATLSIPINSTARGEHVQVNLATGFRGTCEMPEGVESVSPAYLIKTTNEIEFREHVDIKLRHTSNLQTAEDCEEMVFLKANITQNDSNSRLHFEKIVDSDSVNFSPGERDGRLKLKKLFSWFKIGRKQSRNKSRNRNNYQCIISISFLQRNGFTQQGCIGLLLALKSQPSSACVLSTLSTLRCDAVLILLHDL